MARREADEDALVAAVFDEEPDGGRRAGAGAQGARQARARRRREGPRPRAGRRLVPRGPLAPPPRLAREARGARGLVVRLQVRLRRPRLRGEGRPPRPLVRRRAASTRWRRRTPRRSRRSPRRRPRPGPRGATASIGAAQEEALARAPRPAPRRRAGAQPGRASTPRASAGTAPSRTASPPRARRSRTARAAWGKARGALHDDGLPLRDRRALLERAEREYRRKLDDLRATEAQRYAEKDRAIAELKRRAEPKEKRTLVATAYWRCP